MLNVAPEETCCTHCTTKIVANEHDENVALVGKTVGGGGESTYKHNKSGNKPSGDPSLSATEHVAKIVESNVRTK